MKTYGIVLIGCGHIGLAHLTDIYYRDNVLHRRVRGHQSFRGA